jgi:predicted lysophospholipase L1 biosynthesis ABC-type transport system permease subunit
MIATIQLIEGQPTLVFDEEITRSAGLNVGDTVRLEIRADGVIVMTPTQTSPEEWAS